MVGAGSGTGSQAPSPGIRQKIRTNPNGKKNWKARWALFINGGDGVENLEVSNYRPPFCL